MKTFTHREKRKKEKSAHARAASPRNNWNECSSHDCEVVEEGEGRDFWEQMRGMQLSAVVSRARCALCTVSLSVRRSLNIASFQSSTCNCTRSVKDDGRRKGLNHMGAEKVWHGQIGCTFRAYRTSDQRRSQHFKSSEHANSDDQAGDSQRGSLAWMACGAGVLAGFAFWQSMQHVLAEAAVVPSLALQEVGGTSSMRMSAGAVEKALGSSDAATLKPALAALILLVDDNDVENTHSTIAKVASKRILGHPDSSVRNAAVCALSALVTSDSKAAAASLASLINCGTIPECQRMLADRGTQFTCFTGTNVQILTYCVCGRVRACIARGSRVASRRSRLPP